jgi:uncharacterized membrane protein YjjP (DUF1212 family)
MPIIHSSVGVFFCVRKSAETSVVFLLPRVSVTPAEMLLFHGCLISGTDPGALVLVLVAANAAIKPVAAMIVAKVLFIFSLPD